jgi:hypothetical protein
LNGEQHGRRSRAGSKQEGEKMKPKFQRSENTAPMGFGGDERIAALFQPDAVLTEQYFENFRRKSPLEPEKTLFLAVLEDGIRCFLDHLSTHNDKKKLLFRDAEAWIFGADSDWIFSFASVCAVLGFDPEYLRRGLRTWQERARSQSEDKQKRPGTPQQRLVA